MKAHKLVTCGGGPAANGAVAIARLGEEAGFSGYLGGRQWGLFHRAELEAEGVDVRGCVTVGDREIPLSVVTVKPGGDRSLINYREESAYLQWFDLPEDFRLNMPQPDLLLFDGHERDLALRWMKASPEIPTLLDAGSLHPGTEALWRRVIYLAASQAFALDQTGAATTEEACLLLGRAREERGPTVVTVGSRGLYWYWREHSFEVQHQEAFSVTAVDTTGAGDVFHGALAWALVRSDDWEANLLWASAAAACSVGVEGARPAIPRYGQVKAFMEERGLRPLSL